MRKRPTMPDWDTILFAVVSIIALAALIWIQLTR